MCVSLLKKKAILDKNKMEPEKKYPKITIVVSCFNRAQFVGETIESVLNQGYPNLELIIIDDGSTKDNSWEVIQRYRDRAFHIEHLPGYRPAHNIAINHGISCGTGEIMTTLNDKNLLLHKSLFTIADIFTTYPDIEWVSGIGCIANRDGMITNLMPIRKDFHEHLIHVPWNIQHESTFWTRKLWDRVGGHFREDSWSPDYDLWSRFFMAGARLWHLNTILGAYRKLPTAQSSARKGEFYSYVEKARQEMRSRVRKSDIVLADLYFALRFLKPLLRNIPDSVFANLPILNRFSHLSIAFENLNNPELPYLKIYKRNPFRTVFPW